MIQKEQNQIIPSSVLEIINKRQLLILPEGYILNLDLISDQTVKIGLCAWIANTSNGIITSSLLRSWVGWRNNNLEHTLVKTLVRPKVIGSKIKGKINK